MGYWFRALKGRSSRSWKITFVVYENGRRRSRDIPTIEYCHHGFHPNMSEEDARKRVQLLNQDEAMKRQAEKRQRIDERIKREAVTYALSFPDEPEFIKWLGDNYRFTQDPKAKFKSHWHRAKKIISDLSLKPEQYADSKVSIYRWFESQCLASSYADKIIRLLNLYGKFYAKKYRVYFEDIPCPTGRDRADIDDAYFEKNPEGRDAAPLELHHLPLLESTLKPEQYNFMYVSFWLGLRPPETTALVRNKTSFRYETQDGETIIWVFQSKLKHLPRERRWKPIPLIEPEQQVIPQLIESGRIKSPLKKTISKYLGNQRFGLYSPRKGFENLMRDRGYAFENVSQWLGHQSLDRTWKNYTNQKKVHWYKRT